MIGEDVLYLTVAELGERIRARRLSPVELTEGYLERIRRVAPRLNAFATVTPEVALAQAREAEREIARDRYRGPLHGIPYGAKDLLATVGIPTTWGAKPTRNQMFDKDATVVRKLREAGAVLLGKLAMVEFAGCLGYRFADASLAGPGRNPWDTDRWTGGSSSGSGAAVSAGLVGFAIGTETWGSILCPSAFCGLTGIRPTYGLVSRAGGMVGAYTLDKVGPLAHSVSDCRTVLAAIAGVDPRDPSCATEKTKLDRGAGKQWRNLHAALVPLDWKKVGEPEVKSAFDAAVAELSAAGVRIDDTPLPDVPATEVSGLLIGMEALAAFDPFLADGRVKQLVDDMAPRQLELGQIVTGPDVTKALRIREAIQREMREFFMRFDVIVTPNFMSVAPPVEQDLNESLPYGDPVGALAAACGLPGLALPAGRGKAGMPVSFQVVAAPFDDATLLDLGDMYQARTQFHRAHPALA